MTAARTSSHRPMKTEISATSDNFQTSRPRSPARLASSADSFALGKRLPRVVVEHEYAHPASSPRLLPERAGRASAPPKDPDPSSNCATRRSRRTSAIGAHSERQPSGASSVANSPGLLLQDRLIMRPMMGELYEQKHCCSSLKQVRPAGFVCASHRRANESC